MNTDIINASDEGVSLTLSSDTAYALTTFLGRLASDETNDGGLDRLYNLLADEGFDDGPYRVTIDENPDYDPDDEDDWNVFIRVKEQ